MAEFGEMKVEGLDDIEKLMKELPRRNQKKIQRQSLRAGGRVMVKEQRAHVDRIPNKNLGQSGKTRLKKSIGTVTSKSRAFESGVYIGPRYSGVKHTAPEAHLYEFGTEDRHTSDGEYRGRMEATPFVRPSWDAKRIEVVNTIREELLDRTLKEAVKLAKLP